MQQHSQIFETLRQKQAARPSEGGSFADVGEAEASERMSERMSGRVSSLARVFSNTSGTTQEADDGVGGASVSVETEVADVSNPMYSHSGGLFADVTSRKASKRMSERMAKRMSERLSNAAGVDEAAKMTRQEAGGSAIEDVDTLSTKDTQPPGEEAGEAGEARPHVRPQVRRSRVF